MLDDRERFSQECIEEIRIQSEDAYFQNLTQMWMEESVKKKILLPFFLDGFANNSISTRCDGNAGDYF